MKVQSAEFIVSAPEPQHFPPPQYPEIAFAGKSNVGKSTLINSLLNRKGLVKTSSTPGKTRMINFFLINQKFYLTDLPGYGFAKVSKSMQQQWATLMETYLAQRETLKGVVFIVDSRHGPGKHDLQLMEWLRHYDIPTLVIANKVDKLKRSQISKQQKLVKDSLHLESMPLPHSSLNKTGRQEIWSALQPWL